MATATKTTKKAKKTDLICRDVKGNTIPGLCLTNLGFTEGENNEVESRCDGKLEAKTRYGVYQEVTADALVRKSWKDHIFVKGDFAQFTDAEADKHYLKLMAATDAAGTAKANDFYEVISTTTTKQTEEDWTFSMTFRRDPDFQPSS